MSVPLASVIISALPALVDAATRLFKKADKPPLPAIPDTNAEDRLKAVVDRLEYFEKLEVEQAQLIKQAVDQIQNMSLALAASSKRANLAFGVAIVALLAGAGAWLVNLTG